MAVEVLIEVAALFLVMLHNKSAEWVKLRKVHEVVYAAFGFLFFFVCIFLFGLNLLFAVCMNFVFVNICFVSEVKCVWFHCDFWKCAFAYRTWVAPADFFKIKRNLLKYFWMALILKSAYRNILFKKCSLKISMDIIDIYWSIID